MSHIPILLVLVFACCATQAIKPGLFTPLENSTLYVDAQTGDDSTSCGAEASPCKTLNYTLYLAYDAGNETGAKIELLSSISNEVVDFPFGRETIPVEIEGNNNELSNCTLTIFKVNFQQSHFSISTLQAVQLTLSASSLFQSKISGITSPGGTPSTLNVNNSTFAQSRALFLTVNVTDSHFEASSLTSAENCYVSNSTFVGSMESALTVYSATISNSKFVDNQGNQGGAIHSSFLAHIENSVFFNNSAAQGGAIYSNGVVELVSTSITNNAAVNGGGIFFDSFGGLTCDAESEVSDNSASYGGGVYATGGIFGVNPSGDPSTKCVLNGNVATTSGGGFYLVGTSGALSNVDLGLNSAAHSGGGIFIANGSLTLVASSVNSNSGGGLFAARSKVDIQDTGLRGNSGNMVAQDLYLVNSSSQISQWQGVGITGPDSFTCHDCYGKMCAAVTSCTDCSNGCITMGTKPICTAESFKCGDGTCTSIDAQKPKCSCDAGYSGDACETKDSPAKGYIWVIAFVAGCLGILAVVIVVIWRFHRRRTGEYQPLR